MWINRLEYNQLKEAQAQVKLLKTSDETPILGKYFIAEYNNRFDIWMWRIYRIDKIIKNIYVPNTKIYFTRRNPGARKTIKNRKSNAQVFTCFNKQNAQLIIDHLDKKFEELLERKQKVSGVGIIPEKENIKTLGERMYEQTP